MDQKVKVMDEKDELSQIFVGDGFDFSVFEGLNGTSSRSQKKEAAEQLLQLKEAIKEIQFETLQKEQDIKKYKKQLAQHPVIIAFTKLKKETGRNKKKIEQLSIQYSGALQMLAKLGIKLDKATIKQLQEG